MKYKILNQTDNRVELFVLYEDNTFTVLNLAQDTLENMLKNAYILSKNAERLMYEDEVPTDLEEYEKPQSVATKLTNVDFNNFTADIYDQFGDKMNVDLTFEIEGTDKARIEDGVIIEDEVDIDTSYFIVAKYDALEEMKGRTIYAPKEVEPIGGVDEGTLKRITDLEELVEKQATTITNQAIAINQDRQLLNKVDTDLNGLVGDVSE